MVCMMKSSRTHAVCSLYLKAKIYSKDLMGIFFLQFPCKARDYGKPQSITLAVGKRETIYMSVLSPSLQTLRMKLQQQLQCWSMSLHLRDGAVVQLPYIFTLYRSLLFPVLNVWQILPKMGKVRLGLSLKKVCWEKQMNEAWTYGPGEPELSFVQVLLYRAPPTS